MEVLIQWVTQIYHWLTKTTTYNNTILAYTIAADIRAHCNEIAFINAGTSTLILNNNFPILPTQSISFDGKKNEMDVTPYNVSFTGAGDNLCIVIRKYYN